MTDTNVKKLGINGLGRIGKLTLWHHAGRRYFDELVVNIGREAGTSLEDIAHYIERDSTYGRLCTYLYGCAATPVITDLNETEGSMVVNGVRVRFLRNHRNPAEIRWRENKVRLVVDTTGQFLDPTLPHDHPKGSVRGHLEAGADRVIVSAPFKIKEGEAMPADAVTTVMGINGEAYNPRQHRIISNASCTTTCLAHMVKPLIDTFGPDRILSASMATVHASTGSQQVLDRLPKKDAKDLRKSRSVLNNIILTTTGAARVHRRIGENPHHHGFAHHPGPQLPGGREGNPDQQEAHQRDLREGGPGAGGRLPPVHPAAERVGGRHRLPQGRGHHRGPRNPYPDSGNHH
jgi:glyceraldehyde 3-phosphate dehydrogenase